MNKIVTTSMLILSGITISACNVTTGQVTSVNKNDYNYAHYHNDDSDSPSGAPSHRLAGGKSPNTS